MNLKPLALALFALGTTGVASAQQITPDGRYVPAAPGTTVIQPAAYATPSMTTTMPGTMTYAQPGTMQVFPSSMPGSTVLNGTTTAVRNVGTTVVSGTRRTVRRGLGIFRR